MSSVELQCGAQVIRADRALCEMSTERVHWNAFIARSGDVPVLEVRRVPSLPDGVPLDVPLGQCRFRRSGALLEVEIEDGPFRGELALRLAWYLAGIDAGAVLIHACAVRSGAVAFVAAGKSGDGKSTLSRLSREAGLTLLTDEVVMLLPGGRVSGTPFRSDFDNVGSPGVFDAKYFLSLKKADREALEPLAALEAAQLAMAQCFDIAEVALPRAEVRRRLLAFLGSVQPMTLAFRKDPAAGVFMRSVL